MGRFIHREDNDEYLDLSREARPVTRLLVFSVLVVALIGGGLFFSREWYRNQVNPGGEQGLKVSIEIEQGTSVTGIANQLADKSVISNANVFRFWLRNKSVSVQAGEYVFRKNSSFPEALKILKAGPAPPPTVKITIPEGLTLPEINAAIVKAQPRFTFQQVDAALHDATIRSKYQPPDQPSLEGLVYPSTYDVGTDDEPVAVVQKMVAQTDVVVDSVDIVGGAQRLGLSPYQILVTASLIQAEAGSPEEMPKIARVVYNRLSAGTPLGIDATSRYLAQQTGGKVDFSSLSPYNTRRSPGLPPTPIAAPGKPAIQAALAPADGPWIYYVLEAPRRHFFTDSAAEFETKKQECASKGLGCG